MPAWRVLPFGQAQFGHDLFALCRAVPYLDHLLDWLEAAHAPVRGDHVLRNWQRELAHGGRFDIWLHDRTVRLRSGRSVMLADKTVVFGVQGRPDLLLGASRVGFGHPLTAAILPRQRVVVQVCGTEWGISAAQAEQAVALFAARRAECWADVLDGDGPAPLLVTGDANYAHHFWNQLGALAEVLHDGAAPDIAVTHQPIAPLREIFADRPGLRVRTMLPDALPMLDPLRVMPFPAGGLVVVAALRERVRLVAEHDAPAVSRHFLDRMRAQGRRPVWLSLRLTRTARNQLAALRELACALLADGRYAIVLDGYSRPRDYAENPDYDRAQMDRGIAREELFVAALRSEIERRLGPSALDAMLVIVGADLLHAIHLAGHCAAYFANHGTLQHKIGYFTAVPGLVHANPATLAIDRAATHAHVIEDAGVVEYIDPSLVEDVPLQEGAAMSAENDYRFTDVARLVATFLAFLERDAMR